MSLTFTTWRRSRLRSKVRANDDRPEEPPPAGPSLQVEILEKREQQQAEKKGSGLERSQIRGAEAKRESWLEQARICRSTRWKIEEEKDGVLLFEKEYAEERKLGGERKSGKKGVFFSMDDYLEWITTSGLDIEFGEEVSEDKRLGKDTMQQATALLADEDVEEVKKQSPPTFLNIVAVGHISAGKSAVLNSLIGYPVLPTGENGATRVPILVEMKRDESGNRKGLGIQVEGGRIQSVSASDLRHNLQGRLQKWTPNGKGRPDEIKLRLVSAAAPPLKLIDLPGMEARAPIEDSIVRDYAEHNDAVLLLVIPATQAANILGARALKLVQDLDSEGSRTVGVISKVDQAASDPRSLAAVQALLSGQGPSSTAEFPWVALIGQSVSIAAAHAGSGAEDSLETAWRAEAESLKQILPQASSTKLGRISLVDTLSLQIRKRLKNRLPTLLSGLEGKTQAVEEELVRLGEMRVETSEGTRAIALELCREFDDKFLETIASGESGGWKVVASFEGTLPNRFKQLPLSELFDMNSVKRLVLEADGYQPYLLSPEKGLRALVKKALELAKDPAKSCVDEVHRILVDIVSAAASATPGLGRYPPLKREIVAIASTALEEYRVEARKMVIALVDMERAFIPPQHFIRLVQRRMERLRKDDEVRGRATKKAQDTEVALLNKATAPQPSNSGGGGGILKSLKGQKEDKEKEVPEPVSTLQTAGPNNEIVAGYLSKRSSKTNQWVKRWFVLNEKTAKFSYTKKPEEKHFRGVISLEECVIEDASDSDMEDGAPDPPPKKSSKDKKNANGDANKISASALAFKISNKVAYKTVLKAHHNIVLKAENMADKLDWMNRLRKCIGGGGATPTKESDNSSSKKGTTLKTSSSAPSLTETTTSSRSTSDGPVEPTYQRKIDPEEDLRMMAQEVRDYVEAVLNSLAANVPKAVVLCQVERSKDAMLAQLYSSVSAHPTAKIEELLKEDQEVKKRRERCQRQASLLSKLTKQLSVHEARAAAVSGFSDTSGNGGGDSPKAPETEDWRLAFDQAANLSSSQSHSRSPRPSSRGPTMNGEISGRYSDNDENGDVGSQSRRTPTRLPPPPPGSSQPVYRY
ncbi:hypothetical protein R1flu_014505 [Riccia fluitans]|uniref:dynamin GTPase n=1 Tax=Riccia fluitans TaxID=41844 RepID=A0ABD1YHD5_9MARC